MRNLASSIVVALMVSACGESSTSLETASSNETTPTTAAPTAGKQTNCVNGRYDFRTNSDGKFHFDAAFDGNGNIAYNLRGGPSGTYSVSGSSVSYVGPFGPNRSNVKLSWTITRAGSDCIATQIRGNSPGGAGMTATRR